VPPAGDNGEKLVIATPTVKFSVGLFAMAEMGETAACTVKLTVLVVLATTPLASCTRKTKLDVVNMEVGVPVTAPVLVLKLKPEGKLPEVMLKVYGVVPPLTVNGEKLAIVVPTVKFCEVVVATALIESETVKLTVLVVLATVLLAS